MTDLIKNHMQSHTIQPLFKSRSFTNDKRNSFKSSNAFSSIIFTNLMHSIQIKSITN